MKKRVIILSIAVSAFVGALSAFAVTKVTQPENIVSSNTAPTAATHFASYDQGASLPDLTSAAERGVAAVVNIETTQTVTAEQSRGGMNPFEFFFGPGFDGSQGGQMPQQQERKSGGSGVIISADGYIVTNNHVVENASKLKITLHNGDTFTARVIGTDPSTDIALIKIDPTSELDFLKFGNSKDLRLGEWVLAVGNPYGLTSTVTAGIVSAKGRALGIIPSQLSIESFIQTDAAVNPGNSGGALMTADGALVGINTLIKSPTGTYTGYSFAVPASIAGKVVGDILEYGVVQRAILGVAMAEITDEWLERFGKQEGVKERGGIYIGEVTAGGAAEAAGIHKGDILIQIDGQDVKSASAVQENIGRHRPGDKVKISVKRSGDVKHFDVTLRNRNGNESVVKNTEVDLQQILGGQFAPVGDKLQKDLRIKGGVQVLGITEGGILAKSKVRLGFIITAINERPIVSLSDLNRLTEKIESIDGVYPGGQAVSYILN